MEKETNDSIRQSRGDWFKEHPEYTECDLCKTVIGKRLTKDGLCPDCKKWRGKL